VPVSAAHPWSNSVEATVIASVLAATFVIPLIWLTLRETGLLSALRQSPRRSRRTKR
jgi:hypothetical protein